MLNRSSSWMLCAIWILVVCSPDNTPLIAQEKSDAQNSAALTKPLANEIKQIARVWAPLYPSLGWLCEELGDLNGDGYDDYAVSSYSDTTWIFYGGDPIPTHPEYHVQGGGSAIEAADVNGDGLIDLITARNGKSREDPDLNPYPRGMIRIFLNTGDEPAFHPVADQEIIGDSVGGISNLGRGDGTPNYEGLRVVDFNGNGKPDLFCVMNDRDSSSVRYGLFMDGYPYSPKVDRFLGIPRRDYKDRALNSRKTLTGDINGDGRTDLFVYHGWVPDSASEVILGWEIFLGNEAGDVSEPSRTIGIDDQWYLKSTSPVVADINADGYDDIFDSRSSWAFKQPDVWYGRVDIEGIYPEDSLEMPLRGILRWQRTISAVGDMDGDGRRDIIVGWIPALAPGSTVFYFYPNRADALHKVPNGSVGIDPDVDNVDENWVFPVGDVNGDGYHDMAMLGRSTGIAYAGLNNGFRLFGGNAKLVGVESPRCMPEEWKLRVYPNPIVAGTSDIHLEIETAENTAGTIRIIDNLGCVIRERSVTLSAGSQTIDIQDSTLIPGLYHIVLMSAGIQRGCSFLKL